MPCRNPSGADANEKLFMGLADKPPNWSPITYDTLVNGAPSQMWRLVRYKIITSPSSKVRVQMENIEKIWYFIPPPGKKFTTMFYLVKASLMAFFFPGFVTLGLLSKLLMAVDMTQTHWPFYCFWPFSHCNSYCSKKS